MFQAAGPATWKVRSPNFILVWVGQQDPTHLLPPEASSWLKMYKTDFGWGLHPDLSGAAYSRYSKRIIWHKGAVRRERDSQHLRRSNQTAATEEITRSVITSQNQQMAACVTDDKVIILINSAATLVYASSFVNFSCSAEARFFTCLIHRQHSAAVLPSLAISLSYMFCITWLVKIHKILGYARNEDKNAPNTSQGSVAT